MASFFGNRVATGVGFCEKLLEAFPMSDRVSASLLQDGPACGQGQVCQ